MKTASLENDTLWRHKKCSIITSGTENKCQSCNQLIRYFKIFKKRSLIKKCSYIGHTLTPTRRQHLKLILNEKKKCEKI